MSVYRVFRGMALVVAVLFLAGCGAAPEKRAIAGPNEISELRSMIMSLGSEVDPDEADRAARIAFMHTRELAIAYQITDPPLVHNTKVNMGLRPRGLCWHWAEDMERRLDSEGFETLEIHRAIASADNPFRIDHSTAIISRRGDGFKDGIVLDPWRLGGALTYLPTLEDADYDWESQPVVLERKRRRELAKARRVQRI
ncbi:MAG: hypothetical protein HKN18_12280 [Silicimonas sp.]|nr:hypothetical protein [Silicimonas sp.]